MTERILELAKSPNIKDEAVTVSLSTELGGTLYNLVSIPENTIYTMITPTGGFAGYVYLRKNSSTGTIQLSADMATWVSVGSDQTMLTAGSCSVTVRVLDFLAALIRVGGNRVDTPDRRTPLFLSNSESVVNTNGVVGKTVLGEAGSPILAHTAATYYDIQLPRALLPSEDVQIQVRSKVDGNWINVNTASVPSLFIGSLRISFNTTTDHWNYGFWVGKIEANRLRVYQSATMTGGTTAWSAVANTTRAWSTIIAAADGFDAWRIRICQASTGAESASVDVIRAWVTFDGTTTPPTIKAGANVSSVTRSAAGKYQVNFTTPMPHANYVATGAAKKNDSNDDGNMRCQIGGCTGIDQTTSYAVVRVNTNSSDLNNSPHIMVQVMC